jgi:hypothetical protein
MAMAMAMAMGNLIIDIIVKSNQKRNTIFLKSYNLNLKVEYYWNKNWGCLSN